MSVQIDIWQLEADLGQRSALRVLSNVGGQARNIPLPRNAASSALACEIGADAAFWLAGRYGGETGLFPSAGHREAEFKAAQLRADILDAGLTDPARSANDIAKSHGVTERHVRKVRAQLRSERPSTDSSDLPLFR